MPKRELQLEPLNTLEQIETYMPKVRDWAAAAEPDGYPLITVLIPFAEALATLAREVRLLRDRSADK